MPDGGDSHFQINLDSEQIVFRGIQGQDFEPATMSGELVLNLDERASFKEVSMVFRGTASLLLPQDNGAFRAHPTQLPLFFHDFQFLSSPGSAEHHSHTLNAGRHAWPFSLVLPSTLPASLKTFSGACAIEYKLKALAVRKGHFERDFKAKKEVKVSRMLSEEAMEFNQTLEIENTWPGKVMYSITIPHKAYAGGDQIPVNMKFSPLAKGVTITSVMTSIRENVSVHIRGNHHEARDILTTKHLFRRLPTTQVCEENGEVHSSGYEAVQVSLWQKTLPEAEGSNVASGSGSGSGTSSQPRSARATPSHSPHIRPSFPGGMAPLTSLNLDTSSPSSSPGWSGVPLSSSFPLHSANPTPANSRPPSLHNLSLQDDIADEEMSPEIDVVINVNVPTWALPSHNLSPAIVAHKIKWSAFIKNPDGHVSELRCALPITILAHQHLEEARLASQGTRNLLFGPSGAFMRADFQPTELPAYSDHVRDRLANETDTTVSSSVHFQPTPWSSRSTPASTPFHSPPSSRPPSPSGRRGHSGFSLSTLPTEAHDDGIPSHSSSGSNTPAHPPDHHHTINWADSEFLRSVGDLQETQPTGVRTGPSSPAVELGSMNYPSTHSSFSSSRHGRSVPNTPDSEHSTGRKGGFFSIQLPKPLRPLTALKSSKHSSPHTSAPHSPHFDNMEERLRRSRSRDELNARWQGGHRDGHQSTTPDGSGSGGHGTPNSVTEEEGVDILSTVPSYEIASRGFLGGVVPLSSSVGLPTYEDSSRHQNDGQGSSS
ncbi:hypothetical protein BT69DRAFT_1329402 [Atractiella rhizophila]|nr:hypothetical protein BT69DRAFT_1329402 [Atractiella rhizophila]